MVSLNDCLIYAGYKNPEGYGRNIAGGVHRQMYEQFRGLIPDGLELDHLCEVKSCVNPDHLEAVTHHENAIRGNLKRRQTYCKNGHDMTVNPFIIKHKNGVIGRACRTCRYARARNYYREKKLEALKQSNLKGEFDGH